MTRLLSYLSEHKYIAFLLVTGYYVVVVLPHDIVGKAIYNILFRGSIQTYNLTFLLIVAAMCLMCLPSIVKQFRATRQRALRIAWLLINLALMVLAYWVIMVLATETIHWAQYAVMAILLYSITKDPGNILIYCGILGAMDEGWQFFFLSTSDYYDFNDVILNFQGAALGLWVLCLFIIRNDDWKTENHGLCSGKVVIIMICVAISVLYVVGAIQTYGEGTGISLIPDKPEGFWSQFHQYRYHIVRPFEAMIVLIFLYLLNMYFFRKLMKQAVLPIPATPTKKADLKAGL